MAQKKIFGKVLDLIGLEESAIDEEDNYEGFDDYEDDYQDDFDDYKEEEYEEPVKKSSRKSRASKRAEKNSRKNNRDDFDYDTRTKWKKRYRICRPWQKWGC